MPRVDVQFRDPCFGCGGEPFRVYELQRVKDGVIAWGNGNKGRKPLCEKCARDGVTGYVVRGARGHT